MRALVASARVGHLATVGGGGQPHVVPCCFELVDDTAYTAVDAKPKSTSRLQRIRNLETNAAVALVVDHYDDEDWTALWWVRIDGTARVVDAGPEYEQALDLLTAKYHQYRVTRPPGPVIALDIGRWRAWP
jgi:PPOX class probable F420-dependent enzyme